MARDYTLNPESAKKANSGGKRITEAGLYTGKFRAAFYEQNEKGTESVSFLFDADNGQEAGPLTLYTHKGDGTELTGYDALNALMTCMKVRSLTAKKAPVELYDFNSSGMVTKQKETYPELMGKPVGLALRLEEYEKQSGEVGERLVIAGSYDPASRLMASEILNKQAEPKAIAHVANWLDKNPVKHMKGRAPARTATASPASSSVADFADDDIPF